MAETRLPSLSDTERYFEAHITVEAGDDWDKFAENVRLNGWRASKFDEDEVDDMSGKWFMSMRSNSLAGIMRAMKNAIVGIEGLRYKVLRYKIEDTILDSKLGDSLSG